MDRLELALIEKELLARLDLASALSFSFTSKRHYDLNSSPNSILCIHLRKNFINDTHPIKKVFLELIRNGHDALLKEFLALRFRPALRSLPDGDFTEIIGEALVYNRYDLFKLILALTKRRILFGRELVIALGKSGNVDLIKTVRDAYCISNMADITAPLVEGACLNGKLSVLEWLLAENGGRAFGFVYLMVTKAAVGGTLFFLLSSFL